MKMENSWVFCVNRSYVQIRAHKPSFFHVEGPQPPNWFSECPFYSSGFSWLSIFFPMQSSTSSYLIWFYSASGKLKDPLSVFRPFTLDHGLDLKVPFGGYGSISLTPQSYLLWDNGLDPVNYILK